MSMSDEEKEAEKPFAVERAKSGRAKCKKCKCPIEKDTVRIAKLVANPFSDGKMKAWHHLSCLFEVFARQRATTKRIDDPEEDVSGWQDLCDEDKTTILQRIEEFENSSPFKTPKTTPVANQSSGSKKRKLTRTTESDPSPNKKPRKKERDDSTSTIDDASDVSGSEKTPEKVRKPTRDDAFQEFQRVCDNVAKVDAYTDKTAILRKMLIKGSEGDGFNSDVKLWCRMLLPGAVKRIYNLQSKQLVKLFSRILLQDEDEMLEHLEQGDVSETIRVFFEKSVALKPAVKSVLTIQEVDEFLQQLSFLTKEDEQIRHFRSIDLFLYVIKLHGGSFCRGILTSSGLSKTSWITNRNSRFSAKFRISRFYLPKVDEFLQQLSFLTKEDEQIRHFRSIVSRCTAGDLKMIIRLIKHDLRINAGPKHILAAVHDDAYKAFQTSRDLDSVVERCWRGSWKFDKPSSSPGPSSNVEITLSLMTPVLPMLAEACKSVEMAMKKCPNGMLAEVKYDGERVQVHKKGNEFRYFSRSLKPVLPHKVNLFKNYIPKAFPDGDDLILDSEILMIDTKTGQPLPFGTLGIHKKAEFKDANACLFVFDCIYYNGVVLLHKSMMERRRILRESMTEIPNRIMLSEIKEVYKSQDLAEMIARVLKMGLEGLVLKDIHSKYEPGKRHWLKVKKDYLYDGAMADNADLVVLGAWYGTGNKGGMMSVFLMGCYDEDRDTWVTVTKVHTGHDDATLVMLQDELDMIKIGKDPAKVPSWLRANKPMIPDFVAKDPKKQPVWEITGAEFTNQGVHTADGISIRFPRVTRIRSDKDWSSATTLNDLRRLFKQSSESIDLSLLLSSTSDHKEEGDDKTTRQDPLPNAQAKQERKLKSPLKRNDDFKSIKKNSSPNKSPAKSKATSNRARADTSKRTNERVCSSEGTDVSDQKDAEQAEFYAFVNKDYIEYSATGIPLNWIEGRKPENGLPSNAKPLCNLTDNELTSKSILKGAPVSLASGFTKSKREDIRKLLKTIHFSLGAKVLNDQERSGAMYVVHSSKEIPSSLVREFEDVSKTARHVSFSWVEAVVSACEIQETEEHAVELIADYCSCPCLHR